MDPYISLIIAVLGLVGGTGGIYALMKIRPEAGQIVVTAAQGAVIVQSKVIDTLEAENDGLKVDVTEFKKKYDAIKNKYDHVIQENQELKNENNHLKRRVTTCEQKIKDLEKKVSGSA